MNEFLEMIRDRLEIMKKEDCIEHAGCIVLLYNTIDDINRYLDKHPTIEDYEHYKMPEKKQ